MLLQPAESKKGCSRRWEKIQGGLNCVNFFFIFFWKTQLISFWTSSKFDESLFWKELCSGYKSKEKESRQYKTILYWFLPQIESSIVLLHFQGSITIITNITIAQAPSKRLPFAQPPSKRLLILNHQERENSKEKTSKYSSPDDKRLLNAQASNKRFITTNSNKYS
jgi:hypothetical protein